MVIGVGVVALEVSLEVDCFEMECVVGIEIGLQRCQLAGNAPVSTSRRLYTCMQPWLDTTKESIVIATPATTSDGSVYSGELAQPLPRRHVSCSVLLPAPTKTKQSAQAAYQPRERLSKMAVRVPDCCSSATMPLTSTTKALSAPSNSIGGVLGNTPLGVSGWKAPQPTLL